MVLNRLLGLFPALVLWLLVATAHGAQLASAPPALAVRSYVLEDFHSGQVIARKHPNVRHAPGGVAKLMAAYIVYQRLADGRMSRDDLVPISAKAQRMPGSRMFIEAGTKVPLSSLLSGMVVQSANDAALALAQYVAGSESAFVQLMNAQAARMGLANSHFANPTGLADADSYTTAADAAMLSRALIRDFPQYYGAYAAHSYTYNNITQHNRNKLLWRDRSVDGLTTAQSHASYGIVASAKRGDMRLISVVLGASAESASVNASEKLLNYGFSAFETYQLYQAGQRLTRARLWKGAVDRVPLGFLNKVYITVPKGRYHDLHAVLRVNALIKAPVRRGQALGAVAIDLDHRRLAAIPLVALKDVPTAGILSQLADQVLLMFSSMFN